MKNEDIKKLFLDVKNVFVPENLIKRTFFFLLFFSFYIFGQIPINNFGHSEIIRTYTGYTKLTLLDFNNDGIDDIFLYGNNRKNFTIHQGIKDSTFTKAVRKFFLFPIDDFKWFTKSERGEDYYIFVSRNKRLVGLASFTKRHTLQLLHKIELDSYPTSIKLIDLNKDNKLEALIYGNNFSGLAIVENKGFRLYLDKIIKDKIFTDALVCDFNQDDYEEIVLIDMLNNSLNFYESTDNIRLQSTREIEFDETIRKAKLLNYNNDDFFDIAIAAESGMEILLGDSVYSFTETLNLNYNLIINNFEQCDLNSDGKKNLLLFSKVDDKIIFDYDEMRDDDNMIFFLPGLTDYKFQNKTNEKKLITLSKKGKLNIFSNLNQWGNSFNFYVGGKPTIIKSLIDENSGNINFAIYDETTKVVNILQLDSEENFTKIIRVPFTNSISDFIISPRLNFIVGYSWGERLLEKISLNNIRTKVIKQFVYADYPISSVRVDTGLSIIATELDNGNLYNQKFGRKGNSYIAETPLFIDSSVVTVTLGENNQIIYWKQQGNSLRLISVLNKIYETKLNFFNTDSTSIMPFFINNQSGFQPQTITYINNDDKEFLYLPNLGLHYKIEIDKKIIDSINISKDFFPMKNMESKLNRLFYNNKKENRIIELQYNIKKNKFEQTKIIKTNKINNFIIEKILGETYLIYSNEDDGSISFKLISAKPEK